MKVTKALALAGLAALSAFTFLYALKVATDGLLIDDERVGNIAEATAGEPKPILAPATMAPGYGAAPLAAAPVESDERPFGAPDPEFGQARPATGEPAWGAAEQARQAQASQAEFEPSN